MNDLRAITFDAAGTLMTPHPSVGEIYADALLARGHAAPPAVIEAKFRKAFSVRKDRGSVISSTPHSFWKRMVAESLSGFCPEEELDAVFEDLWKHFGCGEAWRLLDGVADALNSLEDQGFRLAVLSNNDSRLRSVLDDLGIGRFFEQVFISWEMGCEKPDPAIFRLVEKELDLSPWELLHVGDDAENDLQAALDAGWQAILVNPENGSVQIPDLAEMPALVSNPPR